MNLRSQYLYDYMKKKIEEAEVQLDPFEHIIMKDFLPADEYKKSLDQKNYDRSNLAEAMAPLKDIFVQKFNKFITTEIHSFNLQLTEWNQGYSYRPHVDGAPRVFSLLIYQPEHDRHPWLGTGLYNKVENDFRLVTYAPYLPNVAMAFACGFDHWHGNELQLEEHKRKAMLCFFFDKKLKGEQHGWDMEGYREYEI